MALVTGVVLPNNGDRIKVENYNDPINKILAQINGNLDNSNISGLDGSKIAAGSLPYSALNTAAVQSISQGWNSLSNNPNTVTYLGNRSYSLVFNGVDLSSTFSPGHRIRTTRTTAAPLQASMLNGTNQYWNNTSPTKLTFTNNFVISAWVKVSGYQTGTIVSRFNGTSGFDVVVGGLGANDARVQITGYNAGGGNYSLAVTQQSLPLNKWVHITAQLDMASFTATPTTSYIMFDGVDVPVTVTRSGTNPTSLVQAGNLEVGSRNGGTNLLFGKVAQVAIFGAKVAQSTMQSYISQGLLGTEPNLLVGYSLSGANGGNDLNTVTPHNLTANNSANALNNDTPFGQQGNGSLSATLDYGIIQTVTYSTNTTVVVQVPEGNTIANSVNSLSWSPHKQPYNFPGSRGKWGLLTLYKINQQQTVGGLNIWYNLGLMRLNLPAGSWNIGYAATLIYSGTNGSNQMIAELSTQPSASDDKYWRTAINGISTSQLQGSATKTKGIDQTTATNWYMIGAATAAAGSLLIGFQSQDADSYIFAENSYL